MIINIVLLLSLNTEIVLLLYNHFALLTGQLLQVFFVEKQHYLLDVTVELLDERADDGLERIEDVEAADVVQQLAELIMYFSLVLVLPELLLNFSLKHLEELGLEQHLLNCDEDLNDHLKDLALCELEADAVRDNYFIVDEFVAV